MQQETVKSYSGMSAQQIVSAINAKGISRSQYADVYDNYVASSASGSTYQNNLKKLGYVDKNSPSAINIYASSFENKDRISDCIDDYNADNPDNQISFTDYIGLLMSSITTIINAISYVLIGFVAISLVVSSIMIGIITYISVLERTKEIGIMKALGCYVRDIRAMFLMEAGSIGLLGGILGLIFSFIISVIINLFSFGAFGGGGVTWELIKQALIGGEGVVRTSVIKPELVIFALVFSVLVGLVSGYQPANKAVKISALEAIRNE